MPKRGAETKDSGVKRVTRSTIKATKAESDDIGVSITEVSGKKAKLGGSRTRKTAARSSKKTTRQSVRIAQSAAKKDEQIVPQPLKKAASKITKKDINAVSRPLVS